jgi:DNA-binding SARP family transcriptional activator
MVAYFESLGPLRVSRDGAELPRFAPKVRQVLALLMAHRGENVPIHAMIDELWAEEPPGSGVQTIQSYVYQLRRGLSRRGSDPAQHAGPGGELVASTARGYRLDVQPEQLDECNFQDLIARGRTLYRRGEWATSAVVLRAGLRLWRGDPLEDVPQGRTLQSHALALNDSRMEALELCFQAEMHCGMHTELLSELRRLVVRHPLHEPFHHLLIDALHRGGKRSEALNALNSLRTVLRRELGIDPSAIARELQRRVLVDG